MRGTREGKFLVTRCSIFCLFIGLISEVYSLLDGFPANSFRPKKKKLDNQKNSSKARRKGCYTNLHFPYPTATKLLVIILAILCVLVITSC
jgi:hypothetical protein